jgi:hypothetical protein
MYCRTNDGGVYIYAGTSFVRALGTQGFGGGFAWNERDNRMYAACDKDSRIAVICDVGGGIEEGPVLLSGGHKPLTTITRGMLFLSEVSRSKPQVASLLDVSGRRVLSLRPGANDVRALAPGVHFVRQESGAERGSVERHQDHSDAVAVSSLSTDKPGGRFRTLICGVLRARNLAGRV